MQPITNIKVYDLKESIKASGYPMQTELNTEEITSQDMKRIFKLTAASRLNGAHAQFLTGIRVNFDLTFSVKAWTEAERYRFLEFVSSQSTMHRITKFDLDKTYNKYVDERIIGIMKEKVKDYNKLLDLIKEQEGLGANKTVDDEWIAKAKECLKEKYLEILYSNPNGFMLTARMTTNYRCLLNIYNQRHDHRLPEWRAFCKQLLDLPFFTELVEAYKTNANLKNT